MKKQLPKPLLEDMIVTEFLTNKPTLDTIMEAANSMLVYIDQLNASGLHKELVMAEKMRPLVSRLLREADEKLQYTRAMKEHRFAAR